MSPGLQVGGARGGDCAVRRFEPQGAAVEDAITPQPCRAGEEGAEGRAHIGVAQPCAERGCATWTALWWRAAQAAGQAAGA